MMSKQFGGLDSTGPSCERVRISSTSRPINPGKDCLNLLLIAIVSTWYYQAPRGDSLLGTQSIEFFDSKISVRSVSIFLNRFSPYPIEDSSLPISTKFGLVENSRKESLRHSCALGVNIRIEGGELKVTSMPLNSSIVQEDSWAPDEIGRYLKSFKNFIWEFYRPF